MVHQVAVPLENRRAVLTRELDVHVAPLDVADQRGLARKRLVALWTRENLHGTQRRATEMRRESRRKQ